MSAKELQEMENPVTRGAKGAEAMPKLSDPGTGLAAVQDLGGPTPENYKADDDSAKLAEPKVKTVKDVVNRGAKAAEPMQSLSAGDQVELEVASVLLPDHTSAIARISLPLHLHLKPRSRS